MVWMLLLIKAEATKRFYKLIALMYLIKYPSIDINFNVFLHLYSYMGPHRSDESWLRVQYKSFFNY